MKQKAVLGLVGWSGSGKTHLAEKLIARLTKDGRKISSIKHAHHAFDVDMPGKDSYKHRSAGAEQVLVTSARRWALMTELRQNIELTFDQALAQIEPCDLVLVEGFKHVEFPKLEIHRPKLGKPLLFRTVPGIKAVASDQPLKNLDSSAKYFDLNNIETIVHWINTEILWSN